MIVEKVVEKKVWEPPTLQVLSVQVTEGDPSDAFEDSVGLFSS